MALVVIFDEVHALEPVLSVLPSANTPDYEGRSDVVINPDLSGLLEPQSHWRHDTGTIRDMTTPEQVTIDAERGAAKTLADRENASGSIDHISADGTRLRGMVDVLLREVNILRGWLTDFKTEVASASNLGDLQTRVATLPNTPDRTMAQARTAYKNLIDAGDADG